jgi:hypothetical protein
LLRDDPQSFAASVINLLRDRSMRMRLEVAAGELAMRYDWGVVTDRFEEVLVQTVLNAQAMDRVSPQVIPVNS